MYNYVIYSYNPLYFFRVSYYFSSFISCFISWLLTITFVVDESDLRYTDLVYAFKEPVIGFIEILYCILDSISFISSLIFIIFFLLLT